MALPAPIYTDFTASKRLSVGQTEQQDILNEYIAEYYEQVMIEILGDKARQTIEAFDWITIPLVVPQKWQDLINGVSYENTAENRDRHFCGFQKIAIDLIYFLYNRDYNILSNTGFIRNQNENAVEASSNLINSIVSRVYNQGVRLNNESLIPFLHNYKDFEGTITSIVDNLDGTLTINTPNTIYLEDGDAVNIEEAEFTVFNLVEDTSFDITSDPTEASKYVYSPFEEVEYNYKQYTF